METRNIYQRILAASSELKSIPKNGRNSFQKYDYVLASDVFSHVRTVAIRHGILLIPTVVNVDAPIDRAKQVLTRVYIKLTAINVDKPEETVEVHTTGDGSDNGDKSPYKGMTGALKYACIFMFMLPQGDDPEDTRDKVKKVPVEVELWEDRVAEKDGICSYCNNDKKPIKIGDKYKWLIGEKKAFHKECQKEWGKFPGAEDARD